MRLRWPEVRGAAFAGIGSGMVPGVVTADIVRPSPTRCAVLDDGDSAPCGVGLSDTQVLIRCTELSKLLRQSQSQEHIRTI